MRAIPLAFFGVVCLFLAGFVRGGVRNSADPELVFGAVYALGGLGFLGVLAAGLTLGTSRLRD